MGRKKLTFEEQHRDALMYARTIIEKGWSCNKTAEWYGVGGSTVSKKLHILKQTDPDIYQELFHILGGNFDLSERKAEEKRMLDRRNQLRFKAISRPTARIVRPAHTRDYKSISGRIKEWPKMYKVKVEHILEPEKIQTFLIRAKSPSHAISIYSLMREHYGYKHLSINPISARLVKE